VERSCSFADLIYVMYIERAAKPHVKVRSVNGSVATERLMELIFNIFNNTAALVISKSGRPLDVKKGLMQISFFVKRC
jgi:hypothetical protein